MSGKIQKDRMEAYGISNTFQHSALEIVIEQDPWDSAKELKGLYMSLKKAAYPLVEEEADKYLPGPAQYKYKGGKPS